MKTSTVLFLFFTVIISSLTILDIFNKLPKITNFDNTLFNLFLPFLLIFGLLFIIIYIGKK